MPQIETATDSLSSSCTDLVLKLGVPQALPQQADEGQSGRSVRWEDVLVQGMHPHLVCPQQAAALQPRVAVLVAGAVDDGIDAGELGAVLKASGAWS